MGQDVLGQGAQTVAQAGAMIAHGGCRRSPGPVARSILGLAARNYGIADPWAANEEDTMDVSDQALDALARQVGGRLLGLDEMLVTAESCTGGWIAKTLTDIPGSSQWFDRGFVTYSNAAKHQLLGVPEDLIERHGAVSEAVVRAMTEGALRHAEARIAVAVSGIAGPDGGTPDKPVGTVWIAWEASETDQVVARRYQFDGDRERVRRQAVAAALEGVLDLLREWP